MIKSFSIKPKYIDGEEQIDISELREKIQHMTTNSGLMLSATMNLFKRF